jgi:hypothetical protein
MDKTSSSLSTAVSSILNGRQHKFLRCPPLATYVCLLLFLDDDKLVYVGCVAASIIAFSSSYVGKAPGLNVSRLLCLGS